VQFVLLVCQSFNLKRQCDELFDLKYILKLILLNLAIIILFLRPRFPILKLTVYTKFDVKNFYEWKGLKAATLNILMRRLFLRLYGRQTGVDAVFRDTKIRIHRELNSGYIPLSFFKQEEETSDSELQWVRETRQPILMPPHLRSTKNASGRFLQCRLWFMLFEKVYFSIYRHTHFALVN
jgi:hypothetical protein